MYRDIGISEVIDSCYEVQSPDQIVSNGKVLEADDSQRPGLYQQVAGLMPQFFENKPVEVLLGEGFEAASPGEGIVKQTHRR